jgi:glutathione S-transferase
MTEYQLYSFAQSGNAYRAALMLNLIGADWKPVWVDFFAGGVQRTPDFREGVNEMGEVPVLVDGKEAVAVRRDPHLFGAENGQVSAARRR